MADDAAPPPPRRNRHATELGDQACFCVACGWARRFYPGVIEPPASCPACDGEVRSQCPACGSSILSVMAVECDECGATLRAPRNEAGVQIRRSRRLPTV